MTKETCLSVNFNYVDLTKKGDRETARADRKRSFSILNTFAILIQGRMPSFFHVTASTKIVKLQHVTTKW